MLCLRWSHQPGPELNLHLKLSRLQSQAGHIVLKRVFSARATSRAIPSTKCRQDTSQKQNQFLCEAKSTSTEPLLLFLEKRKSTAFCLPTAQPAPPKLESLGRQEATGGRGQEEEKPSLSLEPISAPLPSPAPSSSSILTRRWGKGAGEEKRFFFLNP